jgi:hypothetical protein
LEEIPLLIVGGGNVGLEKLNAVLQNSPATQVKLVALSIRQEIKEIASHNKNIVLEERAFNAGDVLSAGIVIVAVNDPKTSAEIRAIAKANGKLVNVADQPELCDFYLSSVVQKGNLKIAISTNGKSPTVAKRLKDVFHELLPEKLDDLLQNIHLIRTRLKGDFAQKVERLNQLTRDLVLNDTSHPTKGE